MPHEGEDAESRTDDAIAQGSVDLHREGALLRESLGEQILNRQSKSDLRVVRSLEIVLAVHLPSARVQQCRR